MIGLTVSNLGHRSTSSGHNRSASSSTRKTKLLLYVMKCQHTIIEDDNVMLPQLDEKTNCA